MTIAKKFTTMTAGFQARCHWVSADSEYIKYHDLEWGVPVHDSLKLFAMMNLEGQQAGLSWITVLKRRKHYNKCFYNFDPKKIITLTDHDVEKFLQDTGLIRNRLKINAIISNAYAYLEYKKNNCNFSEFLWGFVDHKPIIIAGKKKLQQQALECSQAMSRALKNMGFKFVGETICYAFMQAIGMIHEHDSVCYKYQAK